MLRPALIAAAVLALAGCGGSGGSAESAAPAAAPGAAPAAEPMLSDVDGVLALRDAFNADEGHPRLLLVLSPT